MGKYHEDAGFPVNSFGFCTYPGIKPDGKIIVKPNLETDANSRFHP